MHSQPGRAFFQQPGGKSRRVLPWNHIFRKAGLLALASLWGLYLAPSAQSDVVTLPQTLNVQLAAIGKLSVPASVTLTPTGALFSPYTGSLTVNYRVRTTVSGSGGNVTVQASGDFIPAGGPTVSSGPLTYTCSGGTLGTPCSGTQTVSLVSQTNVLTIPPAACTGGGGACSAGDPNTATVDFSLQNDPAYQTGSYTALLTFTISST